MAAQRIYKTVDGRYVPESDPDAAFLAFAQYDEVPDDVAEQLKMADKPRDKARRSRQSKSAAKEPDESKSSAKADDKE